MRKTRRASFVVIALVHVAILHGCVYWSPADPRLTHGTLPSEYAEIRDQKDANRATDLGKSMLRASIGKQFPDLVMIDRNGELTQLSKMRGKRVAVLIAGGCPKTMRWLNELKEAGWSPPVGFDDLVVLFLSGGNHEWNEAMRQCPKAYLVGWPLIDYLANLIWWPAMLGVGADGRFEGFWNYGETPVSRPTVDVQPNNRLNPPVGLVTAVADGATAAPVPPAG